ncbi:MAG: putative Ig domain-containing protein [Bacteroidota bacterium]
MKRSLLRLAFIFYFFTVPSYDVVYASSSGAKCSTLAKITIWLTTCTLFFTQGSTYYDSQIQAFGGRNNDKGTDITSTEEGYIGVGHSRSDGLGLSSKAILNKYHDSGALGWHMVFGNDGNTYPYAVQQLGTKLYAMAGETDGWTLHNRMFVTIYNAHTHTWASTKMVGSDATSGGKTLAVRDDGRYLSGGYIWNGANFDILLAGFYANHTQAWERHIDSGGNDYLKMILILPNGYHLLADTDAVRGYAKDILSVEINTEGATTSQKVLISTGHGEVNAFLTNEMGELFATGYIQGVSTGITDVLWAKIHQTTNSYVAYAIGGKGIQVAYDAAWGPHGHAFLTGAMESDNGGDMFAYKMANETFVEGFTFGGPNEDKGCGVAVNEQGRAAFFGSTFSYGMAEDILFVHWMTNATTGCGTPMIPKPKITDITHAFSWANITLNNTLVSNTATTVTWQMYALDLANREICSSKPIFPTPTSSPSQAPTYVLRYFTRPQVIKSIPPINIEVGDKFSYQVSPEEFFESESPIDKLKAFQYKKKPLPSWLSFDSSYNVFSGTPSEDDVDSYDIELIAINKEGNQNYLRFNINVRDPSLDPGIQIADWFKSISAILGALLAGSLVLACTYYCCKKHQEKRKEERNNYKERDLNIEIEQLTHRTN